MTRRLWPAAAFQFFFIGAVAMLKPAANALVLTRYQSGALPWLYIGGAALTALIAAANVGGQLRTISPSAMAAAGGGFTLLLALGHQLGIAELSLVAYVFAEVFATSMSLNFWGRMGDAFDARESRKIFPWISGVGMSGAIALGLLAQAAARLGGAAAQLFCSAVLLLIAGAAFLWHRSQLEPQRANSESSNRDATRSYLKIHRYPWLLGLVVLGFSVLSILSDFVFRQRAGATLKEAELASLFASAQVWTGVICVVFQIFLAERLLRRLGILRYLALVPATLGALAVISWLVPSVWSAWALKLFEGAASFSLLPVGFLLLYAPLPDDVRDGVRKGIDGFLRKGGTALGGLLLLMIGPWAPPSVLPFLVVLLCVLTAAALLRLRPLYLEALHARVSGAKDAVELDVRMLGEALKSRSPDRVLRAVDLLVHAGASLEPHVRGLLAHADERVQERGVHVLQQLGLKTAAKELEALIAEGMRRPRDEAVWALARLHPERARVVLPSLLGSADVGNRCAAIGALLSFMKDEHVSPAAQALDGLLKRGANAPTIERREVARLLGRLKDEGLGQGLSRYLEDADGTVRRVAIAAVGAGGYTSLAPRLLRFLTWPEDRRAAREALSDLKDSAVPLVAQALDDRSRSLQLRFQLPRVLRQIGTPAAFDALLFSNAIDDAFLHYRVGVAIARLRDDHPEHPVDGGRVKDALRRRQQTWRGLSQAFIDLKAALGPQALVTRAVGDRLDQSFELSFWLLGLTHDARAMRRAHAHLAGNDPRRKAWAIELVDAVLTEEEKLLVQEQIDTHHRTEKVGDKSWLEAHLQGLCKSEDPVLRACARGAARARGWWPLKLKEDDMADVTMKRLFALEGVEIFAQSDVDDLAAVAAVAREQQFKTGEHVYQVGDPGDALYVILEGSVEARREGELLMKMSAKEAFGDHSLFDGAPRLTDIVVVEALTVLVIDRRDFLDLLGDRPELLRGVFRMMSRQLKSMVMDLTQARRATTGEIPRQA
ncbi:MAG: HEAT-like repeat-containing cyclic nucleotide-binding lyase [Myxococcaceae bacterium]|nr:HEAT-like repeat-containing cyclic nucleotide-binding lyase [Myxococcaceae bacterium]